MHFFLSDLTRLRSRGVVSPYPPQNVFLKLTNRPQHGRKLALQLPPLARSPRQRGPRGPRARVRSPVLGLPPLRCRVLQGQVPGLHRRHMHILVPQNQMRTVHSGAVRRIAASRLAPLFTIQHAAPDDPPGRPLFGGPNPRFNGSNGSNSGYARSYADGVGGPAHEHQGTPR
jgi:hypothetical protein